MRSGVGFIIAAVLTLAPAALPGPAFAFESYAAVKRALFQEIFVQDRKTLYCGCPFDAERHPHLDACGYVSPGNSERARWVEVEHVVPASWIGAGRTCWREKICTDKKGRAFKCRKCCLATDPAFRRAYMDPHNLWPTIGEVNERRSNFAFGLIDDERRNFGRCDVEFSKKQRLVEPRPEIRGDVARISLYMEATHGIHLDAHQRHLFGVWHRTDPPDAAEIRRRQAISALIARQNPGS